MKIQQVLKKSQSILPPHDTMNKNQRAGGGERDGISHDACNGNHSDHHAVHYSRGR